MRIEDDVLITESGHEVLTAAIPKAAADVESAMKPDAVGDCQIGREQA